MYTNGITGKQLVLWVWAAVAATGIGCSEAKDENVVSLAGDVTINGEPLPADAEGYIQFMPASGGQAAPAHTEIIDSRYTAEAVPKGTVTAIFHITRLTGKMVREDNAPGATPYPEREDLVPKKHRAGVTIEVEGDNDAHHFEL